MLNDAANGNTLWEVPVDGQPGQALPVTPPGITSITADGAANVLVAGLSGHGLAVSTSLEGPFYPLGDPARIPPTLGDVLAGAGRCSLIAAKKPHLLAPKRYAAAMSQFATDRLHVPPDIRARES